MKRALIIGVSGFVGGYLAEELLSNQYEVFGTARKEGENNSSIKIMHLNLLDKQEVCKVIGDISPDYIINLAAISSVKLSWNTPDLTFDVNVKGAINVLEAIKINNLKTRVLLIGSSEQYGTIKNSIIKENAELNALNPYGISKIAQEKIALMYKKTFDIDVVMVRAFNHIGPKQQLGFVIPDFAFQIANIEKKNCESVIYVGNLKAERDFTDVRDIVRGYRMLIEKGISGEIYNIGSGRVQSIENILHKLINKSNKNINVKIDENKFRPIDTPKIVCDNSKIKNHIGWEPIIDIDNSLGDILEYWRNRV